MFKSIELLKNIGIQMYKPQKNKTRIQILSRFNIKHQMPTNLMKILLNKTLIAQMSRKYKRKIVKVQFSEIITKIQDNILRNIAIWSKIRYSKCSILIQQLIITKFPKEDKSLEKGQYKDKRSQMMWLIKKSMIILPKTVL